MSDYTTLDEICAILNRDRGRPREIRRLGLAENRLAEPTVTRLELEHEPRHANPPGGLWITPRQCFNCREGLAL